MNKKVLLAFFAVLYVLPLYSQVEPVQFKHDIGFNTIFILNELFDSDATPFTVMYKKYSSENKALRLGLETYIYIGESKGDGSYTNNSLVNLSFVIGKEWQDRLSKSWLWYYGMDMLPSYSYNQLDSYNDDEKIFENKSSSLALSGRPFLGIRFDINSRLYISTEANIAITYRYTMQKQVSFNPDQTLVDIKTNSVFLNLSPATGIFLFYRF